MLLPPIRGCGTLVTVKEINDLIPKKGTKLKIIVFINYTIQNNGINEATKRIAYAGKATATALSRLNSKFHDVGNSFINRMFWGAVISESYTLSMEINGRPFTMEQFDALYEGNRYSFGSSLVTEQKFSVYRMDMDTPANTATLAAIVEVAKTSGEIDRDALVSMAESVRREAWMKDCEEYLSTKITTVDEKTKIGSLMATMTRNDARALSELADPYRRGDLKQMIDALQKLSSLTATDQRVLKNAEAEVSRFFLPLTDDRMKGIAGMVERKGVSVDLKTVRMGRQS